MRASQRKDWSWIYIVTFLLVAAVSFTVGRQVEVAEMSSLPAVISN